LNSKDKQLLDEVKTSINDIEKNYDNKNLLKYFLGNLKVSTDKLISSFYKNK